MIGSANVQGYVLVAVTMCIWGGFTLLSRLSAPWHISPWDITALRFALAFVILVPILIYRQEVRFLWSGQALALALTGGLGYCLTVYTAFSHAPAAHAAIFLNGTIPLFTALFAWFLTRQPLNKDTFISLILMLVALGGMVTFLPTNQLKSFGFGDGLFVISAIWWGAFSVLLRQTSLNAWQAMCSVAIWSAVIFIPIYWLIMPKHWQSIQPTHLLIQGAYHGVLVVIIATMTYAAAIQRLGAFKAGSLVTLAPFIAAVIAVPVLHEPLNGVLVFGLITMAIGALQPWRFITST